MGEDLTYINVKFNRKDSGNKGDVSYAQIHFKKCETQVPTSTEHSIYSELTLLQSTSPDQSDVPISLDTDEGAGKQKEGRMCQIRASRSIAIVFIIATVVLCVKIYLIITVSRLRGDLGRAERGFAELRAGFLELNESLPRYDERYRDLNSTLELCLYENARLNLSRQSCAWNLSVSVENLSVCRSHRSESLQEIKRLQSRIQILNATNFQLCSDVQSYLHRVKVAKFCAPGWKLYEDKCYLILAKKTSYDNSRQACEDRGAKLLEINSNGEKNFLIRNVERWKSYRIGGCFINFRWSSNVRFVEYSCKPCKGWDCREIGFICQTAALSIPEIPSGLWNICSKIRASIEP